MGVMGQLGSATTKATKRRDNKAEYIIVNEEYSKLTQPHKKHKDKITPPQLPLKYFFTISFPKKQINETLFYPDRIFLRIGIKSDGKRHEYERECRQGEGLLGMCCKMSILRMNYDA